MSMMNEIWYPGKIMQLIIGLLHPLPGDEVPTLPEPEPILPPISAPLPEPTPAPIPPERIRTNGNTNFHPEDQFPEPKLWQYIPDETHDIIIAKNYQEYIMPDNPVVKFLIDQTYFTEDPPLLVLVWKADGTRVEFFYSPDTVNLCGFGKFTKRRDSACWEQDYWINPDYYIWHRFEGDCEDYALMMGSIFESTGVPYMIVSGYINGVKRDWWVEFVYNDTVYLGQVNNWDGGPEKLTPELRKIFKPYEMFNKTTRIQTYSEWYKDLGQTTAAGNISIRRSKAIVV